MKIAVTGACGHIGSRLIRKLPEAFPGAEIVMIDNMAAQRYPSLFHLPDRGEYRFVEGDVLEHDLETFFKGADAVVHLSAITNAAGSFAMAEQVEKENFEGTRRVAQACLRNHIPLIHLSSTSVYGTQNNWVDEACSEQELAPQSPYAETKLREERLLQQMSREQGLRHVICRFGTIFGVSPGMRFHTAVNKFCWQAVMKQPLTVWKTAYEQKRPYLDLHDAVRALVFLIQNQIFDAQIYNVLTENLTVKDIVELIEKYVPKLDIVFVEARIMNQLSYKVSSERFKERGFAFQGSPNQGIANTINLLENINRNFL